MTNTFSFLADPVVVIEKMEVLKATVEKNSGSFRIPNPRSKIYKEECMYSFQTIDSPQGIYLDLNSWMSYSPDYLMQNFLKTKNPLYLRIKRTPLPVCFFIFFAFVCLFLSVCVRNLK